MEKRFTFPKAEHLCLRNDIDALFLSGSRSMTAFPVRMIYRTVPRKEGRPPVMVLLSVPKRHLRHAVDRNRVKRLLREAYRHQKYTLIDALPPETGLHVAFLWISGDLPSTKVVAQTITNLLQRLAERIATVPRTENHE